MTWAGVRPKISPVKISCSFFPRRTLFFRRVTVLPLSRFLTSLFSPSVRESSCPNNLATYLSLHSSEQKWTASR